MRGNMDPLAPTTHTLGPAISHIAETATSLSTSIQGLQAEPEGLGITVRIENDHAKEQAQTEKQSQRDTVKWVLDTPRRLRELIDQERDDEADQEWEQVSEILARWNNVAGVNELREECEEIMKEEDDDSD
jgi:preprotein translocase subunit SecD